MKAFVLLLAFFLTLESGYCQRPGRRQGRPGRGQRGRCAAHATHVHMHTGDDSHTDPIHQGTSDDTHIHVHVSLDPHHDHAVAPQHASDGYIYAHADMQSEGSSGVSGFIHLRQKVASGTGPVEVKVDLSGFEHTSDGHTHGVHIHQYGDVSGGCQSTGSRFNPMGGDQAAHSHGPQSATGPQGLSDWGVLACDEDGIMSLAFNDSFGALYDRKSYIGRAIVVHAHGSDDKLACGVIGYAAPHEWPGSDSTHAGHSDHEHTHAGHQDHGHGHDGHDHGPGHNQNHGHGHGHGHGHDHQG